MLWRVFLFIFILAASTFAFAETVQRIAGLAITYESRFESLDVDAKASMARLPEQVRNSIVAFERFGAKSAGDVPEFRVERTIYIDGIELSLDGAAAGAAQRVAGLPGMSNVSQSIIDRTVSGKPAKMVSVEGERSGGIIGIEALVIYDAKARAMWMVTSVLAKQPGAGLRQDGNFDSQRKIARNAIDTVRLHAE